MLKKLTFLLFLFSFSVFSQADKKLHWNQNYNLALKKAKKNKKPILVYFSGSDWCAPCKRLKEDLFDANAYADLLDEFNLVYVDIPQKLDVITPKQYAHNKELLKELNPRKIFPYVLVLNKKGKVLETKSGYSSIAEPTVYAQMLKKHIK
ncbi:thioredoxin family protein [Wenyingzhuangia sp. IMCC45533]